MSWRSRSLPRPVCRPPRSRLAAGAAALVTALALASAAAVRPAAAQEDLTPLDVVMLRSVGGVHPDPEGVRIAFTRAVPRPPEDGPGGGYTNLFMLDTGGIEVPLVTGRRHVGGVAWTHDGGALTFTERRDDDAGAQLYRLRMTGGEAMPVFEAPYGVGEYRWSPDGRAVAFTATLPAPPERVRARAAGFRQTVYDEDWNPIGLFLWDAASDRIRRVEVPGSVFDLEWSPDGSALALAIAPRNLTDDSYMFKRLHVLDVATGAVRRVVDNPGKLGQFVWSPDGGRLAYLSAVDARDPHAGMLYTVDLTSGAVTELTPGFEGMVHSVEWLAPGRMRLLTSRGIHSVLADFDPASRTFTDLPTGDFAFQSAHTAGTSLVAAVSGPEHPTEVYALEGGTWRRRTWSNPKLDDVRLSRQEVHTFTASDGVDIEGVLLYPLDFDAATARGTRHPLVIVVHGGPESHYNNGWMTGYSSWGQLLSRRGYFVWYPNYRSSTGRGVAFAKDDHGDLMGREFQDHVDAIEHFVDLGWVDRDRVGLGGGSYGGYSGAWAATRQTEHFAAAVAFVPITHVATKWLTTDIPWEYYYVHYEETWPFEQWDYLEERSPLTYARQSRTPLLLAGGTSDPRVHPSQPFMLYRAIHETTDTPVRYVQYPGEGHGNGSNVYRYDYLLRTLRWFEHYLRPRGHRTDPMPPTDVDYGRWLPGG